MSFDGSGLRDPRGRFRPGVRLPRGPGGRITPWRGTPQYSEIEAYGAQALDAAIAHSINDTQAFVNDFSTWYEPGTGKSAWKGMYGPTGWRLQWYMHAADPRIGQAAAEAVNEIMEEAVQYAKSNHPGWNNRTGAAEASIQVLDEAIPTAPEGNWGSDGVYYFLFLELNRGAALRNANDVVVTAQNLGERMMENLIKLGFAIPRGPMDTTPGGVTFG